MWKAMEDTMKKMDDKSKISAVFTTEITKMMKKYIKLREMNRNL